MVISAIVGAVLGFLAGLGIGGGSLLILWLTVVQGMDPVTARGINLIFFLPCAAVSLYFRRKTGTLRFRPLLPAVIAGCLSAICASILAEGMDLNLLKRLFGGLLIITGLREVLYKEKE